MSPSLNDFDYSLPERLVAQHASHPRDSCKLMVINKRFIHKKFYDIIYYLKSGDVLVLNNTRVFNSKITGRKESGSAAEIVLLHEIRDGIYEAKIKTKNPHIGTRIILESGYVQIISQKNIDTFIIRLSSKDILKHAHLPSPPYIKRIINGSEYQTVYSKKNGSLAAPTAGLHFTKALLGKIRKKGVKIVYITLHISYGTFKNIDSIETHEMDPESFEISRRSASTINNRSGRLFAVGTTTLKALESSSRGGMVIACKTESQLFIYPPFKFNSGVDALITNLHLPKSTLLLLTCAFGGKKRVLEAYKKAVSNKYRFFSLGDAMLVYKGH